MIPALTERAFRLLERVPVPGCLVEFGVYQGGGLVTMARLARQTLGRVPPLYGFDTFGGIPASDVPLEHFLAERWAAGSFADTSVEAVRAVLATEGAEATLVPAPKAPTRARPSCSMFSAAPCSGRPPSWATSLSAHLFLFPSEAARTGVRTRSSPAVPNFLWPRMVFSAGKASTVR